MVRITKDVLKCISDCRDEEEVLVKLRMLGITVSNHEVHRIKRSFNNNFDNSCLCIEQLNNVAGGMFKKREYKSEEKRIDGDEDFTDGMGDIDGDKDFTDGMDDIDGDKDFADSMNCIDIDWENVSVEHKNPGPKEPEPPANGESDDDCLIQDLICELKLDECEASLNYGEAVKRARNMVDVFEKSPYGIQEKVCQEIIEHLIDKNKNSDKDFYLSVCQKFVDTIPPSIAISLSQKEEFTNFVRVDINIMPLYCTSTYHRLMTLIKNPHLISAENFDVVIRLLLDNDQGLNDIPVICSANNTSVPELLHFVHNLENIDTFKLLSKDIANAFLGFISWRIFELQDLTRIAESMRDEVERELNGVPMEHRERERNEMLYFYEPTLDVDAPPDVVSTFTNLLSHWEGNASYHRRFHFRSKCSVGGDEESSNSKIPSPKPPRPNRELDEFNSRYYNRNFNPELTWRCVVSKKVERLEKEEDISETEFAVLIESLKTLFIEISNEVTNGLDANLVDDMISILDTMVECENNLDKVLSTDSFNFKAPKRICKDASFLYTANVLFFLPDLSKYDHYPTFSPYLKKSSPSITRVSPKTNASFWDSKRTQLLGLPNEFNTQPLLEQLKRLCDSMSLVPCNAPLLLELMHNLRYRFFDLCCVKQRIFHVYEKSTQPFFLVDIERESRIIDNATASFRKNIRDFEKNETVLNIESKISHVCSTIESVLEGKCDKVKINSIVKCIQSYSEKIIPQSSRRELMSLSADLDMVEQLKNHFSDLIKNKKNRSFDAIRKLRNQDYVVYSVDKTGLAQSMYTYFYHKINLMFVLLSEINIRAQMRILEINSELTLDRYVIKILRDNGINAQQTSSEVNCEQLLERLKALVEYSLKNAYELSKKSDFFNQDSEYLPDDDQ